MDVSKLLLGLEPFVIIKKNKSRKTYNYIVEDYDVIEKIRNVIVVEKNIITCVYQNVTWIREKHKGVSFDVSQCQKTGYLEGEKLPEEYRNFKNHILSNFIYENKTKRQIKNYFKKFHRMNELESEILFELLCSNHDSEIYKQSSNNTVSLKFDKREQKYSIDINGLVLDVLIRIALAAGIIGVHAISGTLGNVVLCVKAIELFFEIVQICKDYAKKAKCDKSYKTVREINKYSDLEIIKFLVLEYKDNKNDEKYVKILEMIESCNFKNDS